MESGTAFVVVRAEHVAAMRERLKGAWPVVVFADADSLQVLAALMASAPTVLAIQQTFAATSRGATLVARLKTEPLLSGTAVRVLIEDEDTTPLILSQTTLSPEESLFATSRPLDRAGTRQAARYPMNRLAIAVNGAPGHLVDLSVTGAQVQVPVRLRPSQVVRFILPDGSADTRCRGIVAWSIAVPSGGSVQYRAGLEFISPDSARLAAFCAQFGGAAEPNPR